MKKDNFAHKALPRLRHAFRLELAFDTLPGRARLACQLDALNVVGEPLSGEDA